MDQSAKHGSDPLCVGMFEDKSLEDTFGDGWFDIDSAE